MFSNVDQPSSSHHTSALTLHQISDLSPLAPIAHQPSLSIKSPTSSPHLPSDLQSQVNLNTVFFFRSDPKFLQFFVSQDFIVLISKPCMDSLEHFVRRSRLAIQAAFLLRSKLGTEVWALLLIVELHIFYSKVLFDCFEIVMTLILGHCF